MSQHSEQAHDSQEKVTEFVLIQSTESKGEQTYTIQRAIGVYKNNQDAYAAALIDLMEYIEEQLQDKTLDDTQHEEINELCRYIKEELTNFQDRFDHMISQSSTLFQLVKLPLYQILQLENDSNTAATAHEMNESIFKTKVRNFLDAFQSKSDTEEDLGNSDDDEEEDEEEEEELLEGDEEEEEEEDLEASSSQDEQEEIEEEIEPQDEEEIEELEEEQTSENIIQESEEEDLLEEEDESSSTNNLKRNASAMEEEELEEEEDEIDEDNDSSQDELIEDDEESSSSTKKRCLLDPTSSKE